MRTEAPIALGMTILNQDHIGSKFNQVSGDSLQKLTANLIHQKIPLLQPIPLFVYYQTVTADRDGLHFFLDLYQREQDLIKALRSGNNG
jgi:murein L,D-transpeptidase YcbB/YkuD